MAILTKHKPRVWGPVSPGLVPPEYQWAWRDLVGLWLINEGGGAKIFDSARHLSIGTPQAGVTWIQSRYGHALDFAGGANNRVNLGNFSPLHVSLPCTLFALAKADNFTNLGQLIATDDWNLDTAEYYGAHVGLLDSGGNKAYCEFGNGAGNESDHRNTKISTSTLLTGVWYFIIAILRGNDDQTIYANGVDVGGAYSGNATTIAYSASQARIGVHDGAASGLNGQIALVGVYDRGLTHAEVLTLTRDPFAPFRMAKEEAFKAAVVAGWTGTIDATTNPAKIKGPAVATILTVEGVTAQ